VFVFIGDVKPNHCGSLPNDTAHDPARPRGQNELQVVAHEAPLQAALQLATATCAEVEVSYEPEAATSRNRATRVRVLDR
jgi:hypothetical protein